MQLRHKEEEVKRRTVGFSPGDLISNNHNQIKSAVKYPSCFFLKMAPQKKQRATNTKEKNYMILSKTYIQ